jgi:two-component sensor histidine kinase
MKSKLYANEEGNITFSGEIGTYQYKEENLFLLNNDPTKILPTFQSVCYFGDTIIVSTNKDIRAYDSKTRKEIKGVITKKPYLLNVIATTNSLNKNSDKYIYRFNHYGWVSQYNLKTGLDTLLKSIESNIPSTIKQNDKIVLFNKEKGFNLIDGGDAYPLICSNDKIPFARDFAIISDTIFVLLRNSIEVFLIDYSKKQMNAIRSININDLCDGFEEEWLLSRDSKLYLSNNKGILQIDLNNGSPLNYYWIGNNAKIQKPIVAGKNLIWSTDKMLSVVPFNEIENSNQYKYEYNFNLKFPENLNENIEFKFEFNCNQYVLQEHSLKTLELFDKGNVLARRFTINKYFNFPKGLKYGNYEWILHTGNKNVKGKLSISLPLNRNPNFYWTIIAFVIVILVISVKYWIDRKVANKTLLQNQLQILKQNFNPHFIYNSMNLISSLVLERKLDESLEVIHDLSNLQRKYLESNNKDEISLEEEIHFLDMYLNLQQKRFEVDKVFSYQYFIDNSIDIQNIFLPPLILQPIAENAVKYGVISSRAQTRTIYLDIFKEGESCIIRIEDNGEMMDTYKNELGIGLSLVQKRLELYNKMNKKNFSIIYGLKPVHNKTGYRVELLIPN